MRDLSVHSETVSLGTTKSPADDSDDGGGVVVCLVHSDQGAPTVPLTRRSLLLLFTVLDAEASQAFAPVTGKYDNVRVTGAFYRV